MFVLLSGHSVVYACPPCVKMYGPVESLAAADTIIIGYKIGSGPLTEAGDGPGGPDWFDVKVEQVIKGGRLPPVIRVNGWDGMCPYGFILDDHKKYLLLMSAAGPSARESRYETVFDGCGAKAYEFRGGDVLMEMRAVSLAAFKEQWLPEGGVQDKYLMSALYCERDEDCAVREGACGPEAMNVFFDNSKLIAMQPFVECSEFIPLLGASCQNKSCVGRQGH